MNIVVTEPEMMGVRVRTALSKLGTVQYGPFHDDELPRVLADCDILMVRFGRFIGSEVMRLAPRLRYLVTATTGLDHMDLGALQAAGVKVVSLISCPHEIRDVSSTAEHCWALILSLLRRVPAAVAHVNEGLWDRTAFWGWQLRGKRLGVIGHGRIGGMVAGYGAAFGMEVIAHDLNPDLISSPARAVSLDELIETSDVVSLHITADPRNHHLINRAIVESFKPGACFVNTSRGMLVDSAALADAVISGRLAGVALDVIEGEERGNFQQNPLMECARKSYNVLITPHIGGATREAIARSEYVVVRTLQEKLLEERDSRLAIEHAPRPFGPE